MVSRGRIKEYLKLWIRRITMAKKSKYLAAARINKR
jgi:hypothetical protein